MHVKASCRLGNVVVAKLINSLDVFPAHPVCRHRVLRRRWILVFGRQQSALDIVYISRFGQVIDRTHLHRGDGRGDVAITRQHNYTYFVTHVSQMLNDVETTAILEAQVDDRIARPNRRNLNRGFGDAEGSVNVEPPLLHGFGQLVQPCLIIIDEKQGPVQGCCIWFRAQGMTSK